MRTPMIYLATILGILVLAPMSMADTIYLEADFNDKTIGNPIGTGGPDVGEPVRVDPSLIATVTETPMASASLQIEDNSGATAGYAAFEFLGDAELTTGTVVVATDLWFDQLSAGYDFTIGIRENGSAANSFTTLLFEGDGDVYCSDAGGSLGIVGTYVTGQIYRVIIDYNMDADTYDIYLNGLRVVDDEPHNVVGRGVGSVILGCQYDGDLDGVFNVDALTVTDYYQATSTQMRSWGRIKSTFR